MSNPECIIRCPVCHMTKINRSLLLNYQGVDHSFYSIQCPLGDFALGVVVTKFS